MAEQAPVPAGVKAAPSPRAAEPRAGAGGIVAAGFGSAALYASLLVHQAFLPLAVVSSFQLTLQRLRNGVGSAFLATTLAASLLAGIFSPGHALSFLAGTAVPGLLIAEAMARGRGLRRGALWAFGYLSAVVGLALLFAGPRLLTAAVAPTDYLLSSEFVEQLRASGWTAERVGEWSDQWRQVRTVMEVVYPAAFVISAGLWVLVNAGLLRLYLARKDPGWLDGSEFEGLKLSLGFAVAFVAAGAGLVFPALRPFSYNALLVLAFVFALQGLAVVVFYAHRLAAPPLLRAAVVLLVLVNPWAPQILALVGLFDIWLDLRKYAEPPAPAGGA
jgi:hypothetical protein